MRNRFSPRPAGLAAAVLVRAGLAAAVLVRAGLAAAVLVRAGLAAAVLVRAGLAAAVLTAVVSGCGGPTATHRAATHPATAGQTAPVATAAGARWLAGPAGKLLTALNADVGRLGAALRAGQHGAAGRAGARIAADARAALDGPAPPADAGSYRSALREIERAGNDIVSRKYDQASRLIATGNIRITKVTGAANNPTRPARSRAANPVNPTAG